LPVHEWEDHERSLAVNQTAIGRIFASADRRLEWSRHLHYHVLTIEEPASGQVWKIAFSEDALEASYGTSLAGALDSSEFDDALRQSSGKTLLVHLVNQSLRYHIVSELPQPPASTRSSTVRARRVSGGE